MLKRKLMTCFDTLSAIILEFQDVESFVEVFLGHQLWSSCCSILRILSWQEGAWAQIFCHISCLSPPLVYLSLLKNLYTLLIHHHRQSFSFLSSVTPWWLFRFCSSLLPLFGPKSYRYFFLFTLFSFVHFSLLWLGDWNQMKVMSQERFHSRFYAANCSPNNSW